MTDPYQTPEFKDFEQRVKGGLYPKLQDSAVCVSIIDSDGLPNVQFCVELGAMIMLDKPIIAIVAPGTKVPNKLVLIADEIVEGDIGTDEGRAKLMQALEAASARLED